MLPGSPGSPEEKDARAEQVTRELMDNLRWSSRGRMISMATLTNDLRLEIDDYSEVLVLRESVNIHNTLLAEYLDWQSVAMIVYSFALMECR